MARRRGQLSACASAASLRACCSSSCRLPRPQCSASEARFLPLVSNARQSSHARTVLQAQITAACSRHQPCAPVTTAGGSRTTPMNRMMWGCRVSCETGGHILLVQQGKVVNGPMGRSACGCSAGAASSWAERGSGRARSTPAMQHIADRPSGSCSNHGAIWQPTCISPSSASNACSASRPS